ncbi:quinone reductase [Tritrichomonas foetus]|uniref:Quinone reductase n=1 Tax=Tritrichomonas foetus TaxID=1144522 RepID=A0A1J4JD88_9EUKA|nr:quinone reductase [Tritrichomonas foetus]|eukprot:OHS95389.1 quinone reductase [Tritrichomonas foetus]
MKVLILIAHVDPICQSSAHRIAAATKEALLEDNHEVRVVDLIREGFDRCASAYDFVSLKRPTKFNYLTEGGQDNLVQIIKTQQDHVRWCTHIIIVGPMWFFRYPACFAAYFERVWTYGFAYDCFRSGPPGLLEGKTVLCTMTTGGGAHEYSVEGPTTTLETILYPVTVGHFSFCGCKVLRSQGFYKFRHEEDSEETLKKWKLAVKNIQNRPELPVKFYKGQKEGKAYINNGQNDGNVLSGLADFTFEDGINAK